MDEVHVRCYAELNDRLPLGRRFRESPVAIEGEMTVVGLMGVLGIAAAEVDLVLLNGTSVPFDAPVHAGDRVALYPVFESFDIGVAQRIRQNPLRAPRFVLDVHLGKLAAHLRMLGFDASYRNDAGDDQLVGESVSGDRILLSRDRALVADPRLTRTFRIRSGDPARQLAEVIGRFQLQSLLRPFSRCLRCNEPLVSVARAEVLESLPPRVRLSQTEFRRCPSCRRVYWPGTHQDRMSAFIGRVLHADFPGKEDV
jgi:hypothetical protein